MIWKENDRSPLERFLLEVQKCESCRLATHLLDIQTWKNLENENWHAGYFSAGAHFEGVILQTQQFQEMHEERNTRLFVVDESQMESFHLLVK